MRGGGVAAAAVMLVLTACSGPDPGLVADLEATGLTLYAPALRDSEPTDLTVGEGAVRLGYDRGGHGLYELEVARAPEGALCRGVAYEQGSDCQGDEDTMIAAFEEMTVVAVRRGDTVLVARGLVTEADPALAQDAVAALRAAPEVSAEELAASVA